MSDERAEPVVELLAPAAAFELLAHETRVGILRELNAAGEPLSFGALRERVGVDDPGQFNYHLGKLVDAFVGDAEAGYRLTPAGERVAGAVLSGGYTAALAGEPVDADGRCFVCEGDLELQFDGDRVRITCRACEFDVTAPTVPPGVVAEWPGERAPEVVARWNRRKEQSAALGLCPNCDGRLDRALALPGEDRAPDWFEGRLAEAIAVSECRRCGHWWHAIVEVAALVHPAVVAFHHERGVDLRTTPHWELAWTDHALATVTDEDPLRVELPVTLDDEARTFVFDRDLDLLDERRE